MSRRDVAVLRARLGVSAVSAVTAGSADGARQRAALARWLEALDVTDWGLPATAIVALRRVQVAAAGVGRATPAAALAPCLQGAVRPARGDVVGAACPAVWFADEAELLACLAGDALAGALAQRWWWPVLAAGASRAVGDDPAWARWQAAPRAVPAALRQMGPGQARAWLVAAGAARRQALAQALASVWPHPPDGLAWGPSARAASAAPAAGTNVARWADGADDAAAGPPVAGLTPRLGAASNHAVDATDAVDMDRAGPAWLQAWCEVLADQPARAAEPGVVAALAHALARGAVPAPVAPASVAPPRQAVPVHGGTVDRMRQPAASPPAGGALPPAPIAVPAGDVGAVAVAAGPWARPPSGTPTDPLPGTPVATAAVPSTATSPRALGPSTAHRPAWAPARALHTRFGGLFAMVNVALALRLYGDFTRPQHAGLPVSAWAWLWQAGRAAAGRRFTADPLAGWLRAAGAQPRPWPRLPAWEVDDDLLAPWAADARPHHAVVDRWGVRLVHPAGFVRRWRAGAPVDGSTGASSDAALATHGHDAFTGPPGTVTVRARHATAPPDLWALTWPLVRARLGAALGLPPAAALALTLDLPAQLRTAGDRVDLHIPLAALPLALRLAGLDRDPGWLPAAGRDIRFHFH